MALCVIEDITTGHLLIDSNQTAESCNDYIILEITDYQTILNTQALGDFHTDAFEIGFLGVITLFATGFAVGLIANQIRKLRL